MSDSLEITVLMPVRNGGATLQTAVTSILNQSYENFELLIIDDHSSDSALANLATDDPRIRTVSNPGDGLIDALNFGLHSARGNWIARMDADDIALTNRLKVQLDYAKANPDIGVIGTQVRIFRDSSDGLSQPNDGYRHYEQWLNGLLKPEQIQRELFIESPIPHPSAFFKKDLLIEVGGYRDMGWAEDYDLWMRLSEIGVRMAKPPGILLHWRDHDQRYSRTSSQCQPEQFLRLKAFFLSRRFQQHKQVTLWGAGPGGKRLFDHLNTYGTQVSQFIDVHPRRIGGHARDRPVRSVNDIINIHEPVIVAVGARGVRGEIRSALQSVGFIEGETFLFAM